jgi:hypothetical protein
VVRKNNGNWAVVAQTFDSILMDFKRRVVSTSVKHSKIDSKRGFPHFVGRQVRTDTRLATILEGIKPLKFTINYVSKYDTDDVFLSPVDLRLEENSSYVKIMKKRAASETMIAAATKFPQTLTCWLFSALYN